MYTLDEQNDSEPHDLTVDTEEFSMSSNVVAEARASSWYANTEWGTAVLRYGDCVELVRSRLLSQGSAMWPQQHGVMSGTFYDWWLENLLVLEGERHDRIRRLVNPAFSVRRVKAYHDNFVTLARELSINYTNRGSGADFVEFFAAPYATRVLCSLLNIPQEDWEFIYRQASSIGLGLNVRIDERIAEIDRATEILSDYASNLIDEREITDPDDLLARLIMARDSDDDKLTHTELVNLTVLLIFAGIDTTRNQLALGIASFSENSSQWEKLHQNPDKYGEKAVEEILRVNPVGRWVTREVLEEFTYRDVRFQKGDTGSSVYTSFG